MVVFQDSLLGDGMGYKIATVIAFITPYWLLDRKVPLLAQFIHLNPVTIHKWCRSIAKGYQSSFILTSHIMYTGTVVQSYNCSQFLVVFPTVAEIPTQLTVQMHPESSWDYTLSYCCKSNHLFYVTRSDNTKQILKICVVRQKSKF